MNLVPNLHRRHIDQFELHQNLLALELEDLGCARGKLHTAIKSLMANPTVKARQTFKLGQCTHGCVEPWL